MKLIWQLPKFRHYNGQDVSFLGIHSNNLPQKVTVITVIDFITYELSLGFPNFSLTRIYGSIHFENTQKFMKKIVCLSVNIINKIFFQR